MTTQAVFIDPSSPHFLGDQLFNKDNQQLNRDGTLLPFVRLRDHLVEQGVAVHTADKLRDGSERRDINHYWSLGLLDEYKRFVGDAGVRLRGFVLLEPPLVQPSMYASLPALTSAFEEVHVHNVHGDGYSMNGVVTNRLRKLFWPQPFGDVLPQYWSQTDRLNKLVAIAGAHNPRGRTPELYSQRIKAVAALSHLQGIDLYGRGWDRWWSRQSLWWPYWRHRGAIMRSYQGSCASKWETLSKYRFSLCFENMPMSGYVTEKIFDCFYAGTVPVYWGAPDIKKLIPAGAFLDMRRFNNYQEMYEHALGIPKSEWQVMREIGGKFLQERGTRDYYNSLLNIVHV